MPYKLKTLEKRASLAEQEQALRLIPLVRSVLHEIEERAQLLMFLEASRAMLDHTRADDGRRRLCESDAGSQRRELARAEHELEQLGCTIVVTSPLTIQMRAPSGARMLWVLGLG